MGKKAVHFGAGNIGTSSSAPMLVPKLLTSPDPTPAHCKAALVRPLQRPVPTLALASAADDWATLAW